MRVPLVFRAVALGVGLGREVGLGVVLIAPDVTRAVDDDVELALRPPAVQRLPPLASTWLFTLPKMS